MLYRSRFPASSSLKSACQIFRFYILFCLFAFHFYYGSFALTPSELSWSVLTTSAPWSQRGELFAYQLPFVTTGVYNQSGDIVSYPTNSILIGGGTGAVYSNDGSFHHKSFGKISQIWISSSSSNYTSWDLIAGITSPSTPPVSRAFSPYDLSSFPSLLRPSYATRIVSPTTANLFRMNGGDKTLESYGCTPYYITANQPNRWLQPTFTSLITPCRAGAGMVIDSNDVLIVVGGEVYAGGNSTLLADVWRGEVNGRDWSLATIVAPFQPRASHSVLLLSKQQTLFSAGKDVIILMGGSIRGDASTGSAKLISTNDIWYSVNNRLGSSWMKSKILPLWSPRTAFGSSISKDGVIVVAGGWNDEKAIVLNDVYISLDGGMIWALTPSSFSLQNGGRYFFALSFLSDGTLMLAGGIGGILLTNPIFYNDIYMSSLVFTPMGDLRSIASIVNLPYPSCSIGLLCQPNSTTTICNNQPNQCTCPLPRSCDPSSSSSTAAPRRILSSSTAAFIMPRPTITTVSGCPTTGCIPSQSVTITGKDFPPSLLFVIIGNNNIRCSYDANYTSTSIVFTLPLLPNTYYGLNTYIVVAYNLTQLISPSYTIRISPINYPVIDYISGCINTANNTQSCSLSSWLTVTGSWFFPPFTGITTSVFLTMGLPSIIVIDSFNLIRFNLLQWTISSTWIANTSISVRVQNSKGVITSIASFNLAPFTFPTVLMVTGCIDLSDGSNSTVQCFPGTRIKIWGYGFTFVGSDRNVSVIFNPTYQFNCIDIEVLSFNLISCTLNPRISIYSLADMTYNVGGIYTPHVNISGVTSNPQAPVGLVKMIQYGDGYITTVFCQRNTTISSSISLSATETFFPIPDGAIAAGCLPGDTLHIWGSGFYIDNIVAPIVHIDKWLCLYPYVHSYHHISCSTPPSNVTDYVDGKFYDITFSRSTSFPDFDFTDFIFANSISFSLFPFDSSLSSSSSSSGGLPPRSIIDSVSGCQTFGKLTFNCLPLSPITIQGYNFFETEFVSIDSADNNYSWNCTNFNSTCSSDLGRLTVLTPCSITCNLPTPDLPQFYNTFLSLTVHTSSFSSTSPQSVSYIPLLPPDLSSISGDCFIAPSTYCRRNGTLILKGMYFLPYQLQVNISGSSIPCDRDKSCFQCSRLTWIDFYTIECQVNSSLPLTVSGSYGFFTSVNGQKAREGQRQGKVSFAFYPAIQSISSLNCQTTSNPLQLVNCTSKPSLTVYGSNFFAGTSIYLYLSLAAFDTPTSASSIQSNVCSYRDSRSVSCTIGILNNYMNYEKDLYFYFGANGVFTESFSSIQIKALLPTINTITSTYCSRGTFAYISPCPLPLLFTVTGSGFLTPLHAKLGNLACATINVLSPTISFTCTVNDATYYQPLIGYDFNMTISNNSDLTAGMRAAVGFSPPAPYVERISGCPRNEGNITLDCLPGMNLTFTVRNLYPPVRVYISSALTPSFNVTSRTVVVTVPAPTAFASWGPPKTAYFSGITYSVYSMNAIASGNSFVPGFYMAVPPRPNVTSINGCPGGMNNSITPATTGCQLGVNILTILGSYFLNPVTISVNGYTSICASYTIPSVHEFRCTLSLSPSLSFIPSRLYEFALSIGPTDNRLTTIVPNAISFQAIKPNITSVRGCTAPNGPVAIDCVGQSLITIYGSNFYSDARPSLDFEIQSCTGYTVYAANQYIVCTLPAPRTSLLNGKLIAVTITSTTTSTPSAPYIGFSYRPQQLPNITRLTSTTAVCLLSGTRVVDCKYSGYLTVTGTSFVTSETSMWIGGESCPLISTSTVTLLCNMNFKFRTPHIDYNITIRVGELYATFPNMVSFAAPTPTITQITGCTTCQPHNIFTVTGTYFNYPDSPPPIVKFNGGTCMNMTITPFGNSIICTLPLPSDLTVFGKSMNLNISVAGKSVISTSPYWSSILAPAISSISGCIPYGFSNPLYLTQCNGGDYITVVGSWFFPSLNALVGSLTCADVVFISFWSFLCQLPLDISSYQLGQGYSFKVEVGSRTYVTANLISFGSWSSTGVAYPAPALSSCPQWCSAGNCQQGVTLRCSGNFFFDPLSVQLVYSGLTIAMLTNVNVTSSNSFTAVLPSIYELRYFQTNLYIRVSSDLRLSSNYPTSIQYATPPAPFISALEGCTNNAACIPGQSITIIGTNLLIPTTIVLWIEEEITCSSLGITAPYQVTCAIPHYFKFKRLVQYTIYARVGTLRSNDFPIVFIEATPQSSSSVAAINTLTSSQAVSSSINKQLVSSSQKGIVFSSSVNSISSSRNGNGSSSDKSFSSSSTSKNEAFSSTLSFSSTAPAGTTTTTSLSPISLTSLSSTADNSPHSASNTGPSPPVALIVVIALLSFVSAFLALGIIYLVWLSKKKDSGLSSRDVTFKKSTSLQLPSPVNIKLKQILLSNKEREESKRSDHYVGLDDL